MSVLLCDDEPSIRLLFRTAIEQLGFEVVEAPSGEDCLVAATAQRHHAVILDLYLPGQDGLSILPRLAEVCPATPIFVVSAHAGRDVFDQAMAWGATACFEKLAFIDRLPRLLAGAQPSAV